MSSFRSACIMLIWLTCSLQARESVCLRSGFCLEVISHSIDAAMVVLHTGAGTLQFPVDQIESILVLPARPGNGTPRIIVPQKEPRNQAAGVEELLAEAAIGAGLEPGFVRSVAAIESGLRQDALSPKGAMGLMQLMPRTASQLGVDPAAPDQNARGGAAFLRQLLLKYHGDSALALAAYNAGPGAVDRYKAVPPYLETHRYILKVLKEYARQQRAAARDTQ